MLREIPYVVMEGVMARAERTIRRLWILCLIELALLASTNLAWIIYEHQFEAVTETTTQEVQQDNSNGNNVFVGGDYGKADR